MRLLVTGGAGYVGSSLISRVLQLTNWRMTVIDNLMHGGAGILPFLENDRVDFFKWDIRNIDTSVIQRFDAVVNLAALVGPICEIHQKEATEVNFEAAVRIAQACEKYDKRLIALSTCSNYGRSTDYAREDEVLNPVSHYAKTKVSMEDAITGTMPNLRATILRCATAFGLSHRNRFDLMVQEFTIDAFRKKMIKLHGAGFYRPIVHVDDIARAIIIMLQRKPEEDKEVFNVGATSMNYTKRQIAEMVKERVPCEIAELSDVPDPRNYKVSFEKIKEAGFMPMHSPQEAIDRLASALESGMISQQLLEQSVNVRTA